MSNVAGAPLNGAEWVLWYVDTFDREAPAGVEARGSDLLAGLAELWARFLFETVTVAGQRGFSAFSLIWRGRRIEIEGDWPGAVKLRAWVFGDRATSDRGYVAAAEPAALAAIARAHAARLEAGAGAGPILAAAAACGDLADLPACIARLG